MTPPRLERARGAVSGVGRVSAEGEEGARGRVSGRGGLRRSSVAYTTETADGGLRPPQPVVPPKQPMAA